MSNPNTLSNTEAQELALLRAENARLKALAEAQNKPRSLTLKVSQAGAVSVYGLGRFPVTLYQEQMAKLLSAKEDILGFMELNKASLKSKADKALAVQA